ncbi:unnamed protein product [Cladocopium goreaui]|uniref:Sm domain-containing protein n=1 Tax=Cladocopium goreaui TaxID=2562237 RepID=A0A9P1CDB9_9DINO|nr:unnamed protein product [Cladocopium goreaui]
MSGASRRFLRPGLAVPRLRAAAIAQFSMRNRLKESQGETLKRQLEATKSTKIDLVPETQGCHLSVMVLPQAVLRSASQGPALVELKNGDSYTGTLVAVDNFMNIRLEDAVFTPRTEHKFEHMKECTIRGQFVKFIRFPDNILDRVLATQEAALGRKGRGKEGKGPKPDDVNKMLSVPSSLIGAIIGRGGETIKRFCTESGARIEVSKDQIDTAQERVIFLSGSAEHVDRAEAMISDFVANRARGSGKGNQAEGRRSGGQRHAGRGKGGKKGGGSAPTGGAMDRLEPMSIPLGPSFSV